MTTVYDVPPDLLIRQVGEELKKRREITPPQWAAFAKTGVHREMPPEQPDWWYTRTASILRRLYIDGPVGVQRLRSVYGGKRDRGSRPNRFRKGSGAIIRKAMQQLEAAGLVEKNRLGRSISPAGKKFLDEIAHRLATRSEAAPATGS